MALLSGVVGVLGDVLLPKANQKNTSFKKCVCACVYRGELTPQHPHTPQMRQRAWPNQIGSEVIPTRFNRREGKWK